MSRGEYIRPYKRSLVVGSIASGLLLSGCGGSEEAPRAMTQSSPSAAAPQREQPLQPSVQSPDNTSAEPQVRPKTSRIIEPKVCDPTDPSGFEGPARSNKGSGGSFEVLFCQEVQAEGGVEVFENYKDASGPKARLKVGSTIAVRCVQVGPEAAAPTAATDPSRPGAIWYEIGLPGEFDGDYVAANTFWNVRDHSIPFNQQPVSDPRVTDCR